MNRIQGKLILITGASAGIGQACARRLAREGARLVLWARREERIADVAATIAAETGADVATAVVDVRDRAVVNAAMAGLIDAVGTPDVLLNNAGLAAGMDLIQHGDPDDWDRMIDTNIRGLLHVTRAVLPAMLRAERGHIINIGSVAGHWTYPRGNVYSATKFAVRSLTEGINMDLLGTPLRVSSIDPGLAETEFSLVRFHGDSERAAQAYRGMQPLSGEDIADAVAYVIGVPPHVNVLDLVLMPTAQRSVHAVHRQEE
jgi:3-hydroxy acid dehydrogenase / malonic semialdehyde reductase